MRTTVVIGITALYFMLFVYGFMRFPDPQNMKLAPQLSATFGFWSAVAWGVSVVGSPAWNNWFNFFAAALAALALGYATQVNIFADT
jgi:hypothetical protein